MGMVCVWAGYGLDMDREWAGHGCVIFWHRMSVVCPSACGGIGEGCVCAGHVAPLVSAWAVHFLGMGSAWATYSLIIGWGMLLAWAERGLGVCFAWAKHCLGMGLASPVHWLGMRFLWVVHGLYCAWACLGMV
jgi:hypothetical protein